MRVCVCVCVCVCLGRASFEDAKVRMRAFTDKMNRPFHVRYRHMTQSLTVDRDLVVQAKVPAKLTATTTTM